MNESFDSLILNTLQHKLLKKIKQNFKQSTFGDKSQYFGCLSEMLPNHYFEKPLMVRLIWELWIAIRSNQGDVVDKAIDFAQRLDLLEQGLRKCSNDESDYPI
jgi:hypothetical protein